MRKKRTHEALALSIALLSAFTLSACDRAPSEPADGRATVAEIIIVDALTNEQVAYSHRDHWHGVLRQRPAQSRRLHLYFTATARAASDHEAPSPREYLRLDTIPDLRVATVVQDTSIAQWSGDAHEGTLAARAIGSTHVSFVVYRGGTTIYQAPSVGLSVSP